MEEDSYIVSNFHSICRLCLRKSGVMSPLFEHEDGGGPLYAALAELAALRIAPDDGLPSRICHRCLYEGERCVEFRSRCAASDAKLRRLTRKLPRGVGDVGGGEFERLAVKTEALECDEYEDADESERAALGADADVEPDVDAEPDSEYLVEDGVVMVVDPSQECDTSDASDAGGGALDDEPLDADGDDEAAAAAAFGGAKVFMCQYCDQAFTEAERCREHERLEHDARAPWGCAACGLVFAERAGQAAHARAVHACARPYACAQCDKAFGRRSDLRKHSVVHTGVRPYRCRFCLKSFSRNTNLSKHLRIHSGQKPHVCPQCPRSFISKGDLSRHALVHSGAKPFACSVCSLSFGRRDKLVKHEARHARAEAGGKALESVVVDVDPYKGVDADLGDSDERPRVPDHISGEGGFSRFAGPSPDAPSDPDDDDDSKFGVDDASIQCRLCPRRFSSPLDFSGHMQLHEGAKGFRCEACDKTFARKRELDRHAIVHTGFKPYECARCDKKFGRKDKLVRHERTHDERKEYACFECPSTFSRKDTLMAHIKTHFPDFMDESAADADAASDELDDERDGVVDDG